MSYFLLEHYLYTEQRVLKFDWKASFETKHFKSTVFRERQQQLFDNEYTLEIPPPQFGVW